MEDMNEVATIRQQNFLHAIVIKDRKYSYPLSGSRQQLSQI